MSATAVTLTVNGRERRLSIPVDETLLGSLRDRLGLTGAKLGCNQGVCGACTVLVDGRGVRACLALSVNCEGAAVTTVEGLGEGRTLTRLQEAFVAAGAVQCGFCTSGMLLAATALLAERPHASIDEIRAGLAGNICRCTGYRKIVDAVLAVASGRAP
ncbi:MAG TPA: (2Fe-2S)-binding protein [Methylomirabilota bacterium]|jgi:aerobic carbon-monoxide dehydrogenase small subunit|nr:(2Fe-2S)-binding protein [Methylomirabilota bacterium]